MSEAILIDDVPGAPLTLPLPGASWTRLGRSTLICGGDRNIIDLARWTGDAGVIARRVEDVSPQRLRLIVQQGRLFQREFPEVRVIVDKGRFLVVDLPAQLEDHITKSPSTCFSIRPLPLNASVFEASVRGVAAREPVPVVHALVNRVTEESCRARVEKLASFRTRHSFSADYRAAAEWAQGVLVDLGFTVWQETVVVGSKTTLNVIAERSGHGVEGRRTVMATAHLDSVNLEGSPNSPAPGADDNASGSAGVLEMAEALRDHRSEHDLRLVLFGGEEQGLHGSRNYVNALDSGARDRVAAVINMDMIGRRNTPEPTVLLEGAELSQSLINTLTEAASTYTPLQVQTSLNPFNSDHVPFIDAGIPAVLTIEGTDSANNDIHTGSDVVATLDFSLMTKILRMNVAACAMQLEVQEPAPSNAILLQ
jgi:Peptidase family M28